MNQNILLVEDCTMVQRFLKGYFEKKYTIVAVPNAYDAILWLKANPAPELVILDYDLPEMSGYELLKYMRLQTRWNQIPILMLSGINDLEKRYNCLDHGAQDFLAKPFLPKELQLRIDRLVAPMQKTSAIEY